MVRIKSSTHVCPLLRQFQVVLALRDTERAAWSTRRADADVDVDEVGFGRDVAVVVGASTSSTSIRSDSEGVESGEDDAEFDSTLPTPPPSPLTSLDDDDDDTDPLNAGSSLLLEAVAAAVGRSVVRTRTQWVSMRSK